MTRTSLPNSMSSGARDRQTALRLRYARQPTAAWATHLAWTEASGADVDPFRGAVRVSLDGRELPFSLDDGVGGPHDAPAPGELLCAALAVSFDSTVRLVAARMDVLIERLAVIVTGDVDSRGTLGDADVPAGFQSMRLEVLLQLSIGGHAGTAQKLLSSAERHCEVFQTLRSAVPIEVIHSSEHPAPYRIAVGE